jgi:hypothetical protein
MSVLSLLLRHGTAVSVARPTPSVSAIGSVTQAFAVAASYQGWIQPRGAADGNFAGRDDMNTSAVCYFAGTPDIRTDDVLTVDNGTTYYHVTGVRVPITRPAAGANSHTVVDCVKRAGETVVLPS